MTLSLKAAEINQQISQEGTRLGDLRKIAKDIKKDHALAMELWTTGEFMARQISILIMDVKELTTSNIESISRQIQDHDFDERIQLADWFMANQLTKSKRTTVLIKSWETSEIPVQRRLFWYHQARLRWTGQTPPDNTEELLSSIEKNLTREVPEVQWAMNFTAGQIGVYDEINRDRCIGIGETTGLYKDEVVSRGCTPSYLPEFIRIEVEKRNK